MDMLIGWGLLLLVITGLALVIRTAGPPGESRPHCSVDRDGGRSSGGCH